MKRASVIATLCFLGACNPEVTPNDTGSMPFDGGMSDAFVDGDGGTAPVDAGPPRPDAGPQMAFEAPNETWTYVEIEGSSCGNGSPMGVAINLTDRSRRVVLYFQGGGACWDAATCVGLRTASHIDDTLTSAVVLDEAQRGTGFLFTREATNPFADASFIYIPYCTGDVHAGDNIATYGFGTEDTMVHHTGGRNAELIIGRMAATFADTDRVWLIGASAGGYGAMLNWQRTREAFPGVRVDVLSDSGLPIDVPMARWNQMDESWHVLRPSSCTDCENFTPVLAYFSANIPSPSRLGVLAFSQDRTISQFYGQSGTATSEALDELAPRLNGSPNQRMYRLSGNDHVMISNPTQENSAGLSVLEWITQFATDDPAWNSTTP